jgi:hypothetical protein
MITGKLARSNSHTDYVCQVYGPGEVDTPRSHVDYAFGTFVCIPLEGQAAYGCILGYTPRLLVASFLAYLVGEFADSFVLAKVKIATGGRWLWTRTIGSTLVGQGLGLLAFEMLRLHDDSLPE